MWNEAVVNVTGPSMVNGSSSSTQQDYKVWASLLGGSCGSATAKTATAPLSRLTILYQVGGPRGVVVNGALGELNGGL